MQIQINDALGARLEQMAARVGKGPDEYAVEALAQFLEDHEDYEIASEVSRRISSGIEETYTLDEVERQLGLDN